LSGNISIAVSDWNSEIRYEDERKGVRVNCRNICDRPALNDLMRFIINVRKRMHVMVLDVANVLILRNRITVYVRLDEGRDPKVACHTFRRLQLAERRGLKAKRLQRKIRRRRFELSG
jgi:hypothetical protein